MDDRFTNAPFYKLVEYIESLEKQITVKDKRIKELIIESTELEVKLESLK